MASKKESSPLEKGREFELQVEKLLRQLETHNKDLVRVQAQPEIQLQSGETDIPDFELQFELPHEYGQYLIECQNRAQSSQDLMRKIRHMKTHSRRNRFIFVHKQPIDDAHRRGLTTDGVLVFSYREFAFYIASLHAALQLMPYDSMEIDRLWESFLVEAGVLPAGRSVD